MSVMFYIDQNAPFHYSKRDVSHAFLLHRKIKLHFIEEPLNLNS
jgi:hypothetical protein